MKKLRVLLICGSGASSGFMASNIRKAAKSRNMSIDVIAKSESQIENYIDEIDCLMVGPHLSYLMDEIKRLEDEYPVKTALMRQDYYKSLDGEMALDHILNVCGGTL